MSETKQQLYTQQELNAKIKKAKTKAMLGGFLIGFVFAGAFTLLYLFV